MARGERYTRTYSSTPGDLTQPYVIPPIEEDPYYRGREARKRRREQATTAPAISSAQSASAERRMQYAAEARRRMMTASPQAPAMQTAAPRVQSQPQSAPYQTPQMRPASPQPTPQAPFARVQPPPGKPPRRSNARSVIGIVIAIVIAVPFLLALIGAIVDSSESPEPPQDGGAVPENFPAFSTDELIELAESPDDYVGEGLEAYAVVDSTYDETSFTTSLLGYQPEGEVMTESLYAKVVPNDEAGLQVGTIILGRFMVSEDFETTSELQLISYETVEPYDLTQDISIAETGRDDDWVDIEATITNSADVEMSYNAVVAVTTSDGEETSALMTTLELAPGETTTVTDSVLLFDIGDATVDLAISDLYRY